MSRVTPNPDAEPVLLIHGIAMREARFAKMVERLADGLGPEYRLVPCYWGDLAADGQHLDKVIGRHPERSDGTKAWLSDTVDYATASTRGKAQAWARRRSGDHRGAQRARQHAVRHRKQLRGKVHGYLHDRFREVRLMLTDWLLPFTADVMIYQSPTRRAPIHARVRETIRRELGEAAGSAEQPVKVLAHSLGGVIAFDLAVAAEEAMHWSHLITLGSQPAFFHAIDPRPGVLAAFEDEPVTLPGTVQRWTNIWDQYDLVAFGADEVFRMHDGTPPRDVAVRCYRSRLQGAAFLQSHLGYWDKEPALKEIRRALRM